MLWERSEKVPNLISDVEFLALPAGNTIITILMVGVLLTVRFMRNSLSCAVKLCNYLPSVVFSEVQQGVRPSSSRSIELVSWSLIAPSSVRSIYG
ncbi:hypothetical protein EVAR_51049_1 [Eumeta japonica]|uniref:Uncharacterized protein n=1 Tax=Eumeta variegata TaxID=151549 RepID=A0A4C1ZC56_EUMVA|nr:hypothetical protein EVAR_51049_1 [Eumeta japonica]